MNETIIVTEGQAFKITKRIGTVEHVQIWSKTNFSSTTEGGTQSSSPRAVVTSWTHTSQRVFITNKAGEEWTFDINEDFAVRPGHEIVTRYVNANLAYVKNVDLSNDYKVSMDKHLLHPISLLLIVFFPLAIVYSLLSIALDIEIPEIDKIFVSESLIFNAIFIVSVLALIMITIIYSKSYSRMKNDLEPIVFG